MDNSTLFDKYLKNFFVEFVFNKKLFNRLSLKKMQARWSLMYSGLIKEKLIFNEKTFLEIFRIFRIYDSNNDGVIDFVEFMVSFEIYFLFFQIFIFFIF